jgi:hypothetical protein
MKGYEAVDERRTDADRTGADLVERRVPGGPVMAGSADAIELTLPADTRLVRLARLMASGIAAATGFDVDEIEDLRIAVDEVCAGLIDRGSGPLHLRFVTHGGALEVEAWAPCESDDDRGGVSEHDELSSQILDVVVDDWHREVVGGQVRYRMRTRPVGAGG